MLLVGASTTPVCAFRDAFCLTYSGSYAQRLERPFVIPAVHKGMPLRTIKETLKLCPLGLLSVNGHGYIRTSSQRTETKP